MTCNLSAPALFATLALFSSQLTTALNPPAQNSLAKNPPTASLTVWVKGDDKPVPNAQVYIESKVDSYEDTGNTSKQGRARFSKIPPGKILLQVTAVGWKTSGSEEDLAAGENTVEVNLEQKPPALSQ